MPPCGSVGVGCGGEGPVDARHACGSRKADRVLREPAIGHRVAGAVALTFKSLAGWRARSWHSLVTAVGVTRQERAFTTGCFKVPWLATSAKRTELLSVLLEVGLTTWDGLLRWGGSSRQWQHPCAHRPVLGLLDVCGRYGICSGKQHLIAARRGRGSSYATSICTHIVAPVGARLAALSDTSRRYMVIYASSGIPHADP